jgi:GNAT superfamily N-acetyltransferase
MWGRRPGLLVRSGFRLPKKMHIRPATTADLDTIVHHRIAMFRDMGYPEAVLTPIEEVSRPLLTHALANGEYHGALAEADSAGVIGGGGVLIVPWPGTQPRRGWIQNVYVVPEFRRRGIAREIMRALIDWCRSQGFDSVNLHASAEGRPLYEQLGFTATNEMRLSLRLIPFLSGSWGAGASGADPRRRRHDTDLVRTLGRSATEVIAHRFHHQPGFSFLECRQVLRAGIEADTSGRLVALPPPPVAGARLLEYLES